MKSRTKPSHRVLAIFFTITFLQTLIPYNQLWANNNGPNAPEAASFEPVDATDMVNLLTGDMSYVLPLLNVPSPEGGYPLALSYHAGIAMDQEASWVGLGWSLNPGAINRYVSGIPDDWKSTKKYSVFYDEGGVAKSYTGGVGVGWGEGAYSVGLYASYSENQSSHGENSHNFDIGAYASIGPISGNLGTSGASLGISASFGIGKINKGQGLFTGSLGLSINQSFENGNTSIDPSASISLSGNAQNKALSTGISWSSKGGLSGNILGLNASLSGSQSLSRQLSITNKIISAYIPIPFTGGLVNINGTYRKTRYWAYENDYSIFDGSLYASNVQNSLNNSLFDYKVAFDSYESYYETDTKEQSKTANYTAIAYDGYSVSAQGISGNIKPYIFEDAILRNQERTIDTDGNGYATSAAFYNYPTTSSGDKFTKDFSDIHFYFENENSSFLKVKSGNWTTSNSNYSNIFDINTSNRTTDAFVNINGKTYNGYNASNKRLRKGSFIETYTNQQILDIPSRIIKPYSFNREKDRVPKDGIGAYKVTAVDGKTYHYSLPVYQHEKFSRVAEKTKDIEKQFSEEAQLYPYATHWLLTAVTGPDYVDINNNQIVDEADFGYWIGFDYGMWSEGFGWRTPTEGYEISEKTKVYEWGIKEIYYLDKIKTRTHTALFVKSERRDNMSSSNSLNVGSRSNPKVYNDIHINSFIIGDDNKSYFNGVYNEIPPRFGTHRIESRHNFFLNLKAQKSLKLDRIILLKNNSTNINISKTNPSESSEIIGGEIKIDENFQQFDILGRDLGTITNLVTDRNWKANIYKNILDSNDINRQLSSLDNVVKTIQFNTSYDLASNSPNSLASNKGKLTLKGVRFIERNGKWIMPPYTFEYYNTNAGFNNDAKDNWGYIDSAPQSWSLNKIITPLGSSISVEYEEDKFQYEAAITSPSETNAYGGGIRVKNLSLELEGEKFITSYNYNIPGTTVSSGVTSYSPSKIEKEVKYIGEIPSPSVMYEYVTVEQRYATNQIKYKDVFHFNVLKKMVEKNGGFEMGSMLSLKKTQNSNQNVNVNNQNLSINFSKFELVDHTTSLGSLISKKSYNAQGHLISNLENKFYTANEIQQGTLQETNKMYKKVREGSSFKNLLSASSKTKLPHVLKSTTSYSGNQKNTSYFDSYDFLTGQVTNTRSKLSNGIEIRSKSFPAYTKYNLMGSKADNLSNKNMLTQTAANITQSKIGAIWKTTSAGISTWDNNWTYQKFDGSIEPPLTNAQKIWRKHRSYIWKGDIDSDGVYIGYTGDFDSFNWVDIDGTQTNAKWINTSSTEKYGHYSTPLESSDINGNHVATKMANKHSKVIAIANAKYHDMYYCGAEYFAEGSTTYFDGEVKTYGNAIEVNTAHTGKKVVRVNGGVAFEVKLPADPDRIAEKSKFRVSIWVRKGQESKPYIKVQNGTNFPLVKSFNANETITAGNWVLLNSTINILENQAIVSIECKGTTDVDDFRLHPVSSNMTSYVYNEWDELTHIIGTNNLATRYIYDDAGRLVKTYVEVIDTPQVTGGFKLSNTLKYKYKNQ